MPPPPPLRTCACDFRRTRLKPLITPFGRTRCNRITQSAATSRYALDATQRFRQWAHQQDIPAVICFPTLGWFVKFSRDERPGGSLPAFTGSDVASRLGSRPLLTGSTPIPPITGRLSLSPPSHTRRPISAPCGSLSRMSGRPTGLPRSVQVPVWVRSCLSAGGSSSVMDELGASIPDPLPFWPKPVSIFGLFQLTTFISSSHLLTIPHYPSPRTPDAGARSVFSRFHCHPEG